MHCPSGPTQFEFLVLETTKINSSQILNSSLYRFQVRLYPQPHRSYFQRVHLQFHLATVYDKSNLLYIDISSQEAG